MALDFEIIETYDPNDFILYDTSDWTGLGTAEVSILAPECTTPDVILIDKNLINVFNTSQLNEITTEYFPDGLYEIIIKDNPETVSETKYHLRLTRIRNKIDKLYVRCITDCNDYGDEFKNRLLDLNVYLDAAEAHLRNNFNDKAVYFFKTALKKINTLSECKDCN